MENKDIKDTVNKVWNSVKKISKEAFEKSKEYAIIAELKIKQKSLQKDRNRIYRNLGEIVYDLIKETEKNIENKEQVLSRFRDIEKVNEELNEVLLEIKRVKQEYNLKQEEIEKIVPKEDENIDDEKDNLKTPLNKNKKQKLYDHAEEIGCDLKSYNTETKVTIIEKINKKEGKEKE
ncbi:MAG TPA: hypothetical protein VKN74_00650 [Candidatus Mcinerneyibacterium sp.]|nr:hypothetical protein [Candidatus Mcinerneyibacterium sp.]